MRGWAGEWGCTTMAPGGVWGVVRRGSSICVPSTCLPTTLYFEWPGPSLRTCSDFLVSYSESELHHKSGRGSVDPTSVPQAVDDGFVVLGCENVPNVSIRGVRV